MEMRGKRILLIGADAALRQSLAEQLALLDEAVTMEAGSGAEAVAAVAGQSFDAVILDAELPDMDGPDLCRALRRNGMAAPILMLTPPGIDTQALRDRESGPNACIAKPVRLGALLTRLRAELRRSDTDGDAMFSIGPYNFQVASKLLLEQPGGRKIRLTEKEVRILKYLYQARDKEIGRETLLGEVWGYNAAVDTHTLETHIYRLRRKIERDPSKAEILVTGPGGYRLVP